MVNDVYLSSNCESLPYDSQKDENIISSSYLTTLVNDKQKFDLSDYQDPFFYEQPLNFNFNQSIISKVESEQKIGDQVLLKDKLKLNKSLSCKKELFQTKSVYEQPKKLKKSKENIQNRFEALRPKVINQVLFCQI